METGIRRLMRINLAIVFVMDITNYRIAVKGIAARNGIVIAYEIALVV